jgi:predicted transcriptional regulator
MVVDSINVQKSIPYKNYLKIYYKKKAKRAIFMTD